MSAVARWVIHHAEKSEQEDICVTQEGATWRNSLLSETCPGFDNRKHAIDHVTHRFPAMERFGWKIVEASGYAVESDVFCDADTDYWAFAHKAKSTQLSLSHGVTKDGRYRATQRVLIQPEGGPEIDRQFFYPTHEQATRWLRDRYQALLSSGWIEVPPMQGTPGFALRPSAPAIAPWRPAAGGVAPAYL